MPSAELILAILVGLGPYFLGAFLLAFVLALFLPWGLTNAGKWYPYGVIVLCLFMQGSGGLTGEGSAYKQVSWTLLYVLTLAVLYRTRRDDPEIPSIHLPWEQVALFAFVLLTAAWSPAPVTTLKRFVLLAGLMLIAVLVSRLSIKAGSMARSLAPALATFLLLGGVVALAFPRLAFDSDGALRSLTSHKNTWGQFSALGVLLFTHLVLTGVRRAAYLPLTLVAVAMVVLSKSSTSLLTSGLGVTLLLLFHAIRRGSLVGRLLLLGGGVSVAIGTLVFTVLHGELPFGAAIDLVYRLTERNATLTGRTQLWMLMGQEIAQHPWLGLGYGSFWTGLQGPSARIAYRVDWGPPNQAHNGYLDLVNEIGLVGALLMLIVVVRHLWRCHRLYRHGEAEQAALHTTLIVAFLVLNYAETTMLLGTSFSFIVVMCSIVEVSRRHAMLRRTPPAARRHGRAVEPASPSPDEHRLAPT